VTEEGRNRHGAEPAVIVMEHGHGEQHRQHPFEGVADQGQDAHLAAGGAVDIGCADVAAA
jgi:hypothetical protein